MARGIGLGLVVVGLAAVAFVPFQLWGTALYQHQAQSHLRHQLATELAAPLPEPLPGAPGAASVHARLATHLGTTTGAPRTGDPVEHLTIPAIGLSQVVVDGVAADQLRRGPGHYRGTTLPGQPGNASVGGHRATYAAPFYNLNVLKPRDFIYVLTAEGLFRCSVVRSLIVAPTDVAVLDSAPSESTLTLTTCNPRHSAAQRLVVVAAFSGNSASGTPVAAVSAQPPGTSAARPRSVQPDNLGGQGGNTDPIIGWALATLAAVVLTRLAWKWTPRRGRWPVTSLDTLLSLGTLFRCFTAVSLTLAASF